MNTIIIGGIEYKVEGMWRESLKEKVYDSKGVLLPFPVDGGEEWDDKEAFLGVLENVQDKLMNKKNFIPYDKGEAVNRDCLLCGKKDIETGVFNINGIRWSSGLKHYIKKHNVRVRDQFEDYVYRFYNMDRTKTRVVGRINGRNVVKSDMKYLKVDRNQILILDALYEHGGQKLYAERAKDKKKIKYKFSEHSGALDFGINGLDNVIISANTTRVSPDDDDIFLPQNMIDAINYHYIFHSHPAPYPGARVEQGILYEFPSISDIYHYLDHQSHSINNNIKSNIQGSIVICPEGMYIVRKYKIDDKKIVINEDKLYEEFMKKLWKCQDLAIKKYGTKFSPDYFYSVIAQDRSYIKKLNKVLNKHKLHIDYYSRVKDSKEDIWFIDTVYLPVYVTELV